LPTWLARPVGTIRTLPRSRRAPERNWSEPVLPVEEESAMPIVPAMVPEAPF
jgi:hypothetical protein